MEKIIAVPLEFLAWFYYLLPTGFKLGIIRLFSLILEMIRVRSEVIEMNLKIAFPKADKSKLTQLKKESYRHLSFLFFEIF